MLLFGDGLHRWSTQIGIKPDVARIVRHVAIGVDHHQKSYRRDDHQH